MCAPTRAEFLTGRYHPRTGVSGVSRGEGRANPDETTIAEKPMDGVSLVPLLRGQDDGWKSRDLFSVWGKKATVSEAFDPPLYDKSKERVKKSHYFVKDFKPLVLGSLQLRAGTGVLRLTAPTLLGEAAIDLHSIELRRN